MLVLTEDIATATGMTVQTVLERIKASNGAVECAKIGGKWLISSEAFPSVLRSVIEGVATARKNQEKLIREARDAKRRMYHWLYRHPERTEADWRAITHAATGRIKGSERVAELAKLARIGRRAKAARSKARKEVSNAAYRKQSLTVVLANAEEKCDPGTSGSSGDVRASASGDAGDKTRSKTSDSACDS